MRAFFVKMKDENFITIAGWMRTRLNLTGNELIIYACIYGFCQNGEGKYEGSLNYLSDAVGVTKENVRLILKRLIEKGLLIKIDKVYNGVKFCNYIVNFEAIYPALKQCHPGIETMTNPALKQCHPGIETMPNNKEDNNNHNKEDKNKSLLLELDITPEGIKVDKKVCEKINKLLLDVTFPFDDKATKRKFFILCCMPNWRTKTIHAVQMQLNKLAKYDLEYINQLIDNSIMNGWQGLVYKDTDEQYERWKKQQSGTQFKQIENPEEKQAMLDYLNENW